MLYTNNNPIQPRYYSMLAITHIDRSANTPVHLAFTRSPDVTSSTHSPDVTRHGNMWSLKHYQGPTNAAEGRLNLLHDLSTPNGLQSDSADPNTYTKRFLARNKPRLARLCRLGSSGDQYRWWRPTERQRERESSCSWEGHIIGHTLWILTPPSLFRAWLVKKENWGLNSL